MTEPHTPPAERGTILLVVEDEESLRTALAEKLEREGFEVFTANDGEEGLTAARKRKPDLILLDLLMPRMDGVTMLRTLRANPEGKNIKVIVLTNLGTNEKISECIAQGALGYIVKSDWDLDQVVSFIREKLAAPGA